MVGSQNKLNLEDKLKTYISAFNKVVDIEKIILFGSYAKGTAGEFSDIDIALVSKELDPNKPTFIHNIELAKKAEFYDEDLQLFAFPFERFEKEEGVQSDFIKEIKKTGKVIYSK